MALELLTSYRKKIERLDLVPSDSGRFEVSLGGKLIFSKVKEGRFPEPKELKQLIGSA